MPRISVSLPEKTKAALMARATKDGFVSLSAFVARILILLTRKKG